MSTSPDSQPVIRLLISAFMALLWSSYSVGNDDLDNALDKTSAVQSSEIGLIEARLDLERWKLAQLDELHSQGHASWLELRRHQLRIDTIAARLKPARNFQLFLSEVKTKKRSLCDGQPAVYRERRSSPIKIFLHGSIRLIRWIESESAPQFEKLKPNKAKIEAARERLAKAHTRADIAETSEGIAANWREKFTLELAVAQRELEHAQALEDSHMLAGNEAEFSVYNLDLENYVTATQDENLALATQTVQQAEAAAVGYIKSAKLMLVREQRRAKAIRRLHSGGFASAKELENINERVSKLKMQLDAFTSHRKALSDAIKNDGISNEPVVATNHDSVDQWPEVVFNDNEYTMHLVELRREFYDEIAIAESRELKANFLQCVLKRLKAAPTQSKSNRPIAAVLNEGQLNEIESYEMDIEFAKAALAATHERQQILVHEENRFIRQIIVQNNAAHEQSPRSGSTSIDVLGRLSPLHTTAILAFDTSSKPMTRVSYLEFGDVDISGRSAKLSFDGTSPRFVESPFSFTSLELFKTSPMQPQLLIGKPRRSRLHNKSLVLEPVWTKYFHSKLRQNSEQTLRMSGPPYYDAWPQKVFYGQYGYRAFGGRYAYPNGIQRADWRSNLTPGQVPWYAPGSAANIRANQLYYRREGISKYDR